MVLMVNPYSLYRVEKHITNIEIFIRKLLMELSNHHFYYYDHCRFQMILVNVNCQH